jgi:hypothetical protein
MSNTSDDDLSEADEKANSSLMKRTTEVPTTIIYTDNPVIKLYPRERPFIWVWIYRTDQGSSGGFAKRKFLIDTGAMRSAVPLSLARDILKATSRGGVSVRTATGASHRRIIRIRLETRTKANVDYVVTSNVILRCSTREDAVLTHGLLGMDWIMAVQPQFTYAKQARARPENEAERKDGQSASNARDRESPITPEVAPVFTLNARSTGLGEIDCGDPEDNADDVDCG